MRQHFEDLDRRELLRYVGGGGALALAGCMGDQTASTEGGGTDPGTGETPSSTSQNEPLTQGGHARVSYVTGVDNLNPLKGTYASYIIGDWMYSKLTTFNHELKLEPDLATGWQVNDAGDEWTFSLRDDATFAYNGKRVLAEDVKASFDVILSSEKAPGAAQSVGPLESTEVVNDTSVKLKYEHPYLNAPDKLAYGKSKILPKEVIESDWEALASKDFGSGPFVLKDFEHGSYYRFSAFDDYYKTDDEGNTLPYVDELTMKVFEDAVAKVKALRDRRLDAVQRLSVKNSEQVSQSDDHGVVAKQYGQWLPIVLTNTLEPMDDVRVRKAMKYAVDKRPMVKAANGHAVRSSDQPIAPPYKYYANLSDKFGPGPKLDKAKQLLKEAGYGDGFELPPLWYSKQGNPLREPIALLFQQQMKKLGIDFELKVVTTSRWLSEAWNEPNYWYISNWGIYLLENSIFTLACTSDAPWNEMKFSNEEFDNAVQQAIRAQSQEKKQRLYEEAQRILRDRGGWIIPFYKNRMGAKANYTKDFNVESTATRCLMEPVHLTDNAPKPPKK